MLFVHPYVEEVAQMVESRARVFAVVIASVGLMAASPAPPEAAKQAAGALSLMDLYLAAQTANPGVKAAQAGLNAANYAVRDSYFGFLPRASLIYNPQREYQKVLSTDNPVYQVG